MDFSIDLDLQLKDAGLIAADDICQVDSADAILDLGLSRVDARVIIDASAVEVDSGNESFLIGIEFSNSVTFASGVVMGPMQALGDAAAALFVNADTDNGVGRYELPFTNEINGVTYRYMRLAVDVTGTIGTGVNFTAWVVKAP
jgi:hypothetical protein